MSRPTYVDDKKSVRTKAREQLFAAAKRGTLVEAMKKKPAKEYGTLKGNRDTAAYVDTAHD